MTLALAIEADDCIVVASDMRASDDFAFNDATLKSLPLWPDQRHLALFSGDVGIATEILGRLREELRTTDCDVKYADIGAAARMLGDVAREYYDEAFPNEHFDGAPSCSFIVAGYQNGERARIYTLQKYRRFTISRANMLPTAIGVTDVFDQYVAAIRWRLSPMTEEKALRLAALTMAATRKSSQVVSENSLFWVLPKGLRVEGEAERPGFLDEEREQVLREWADKALGSGYDAITQAFTT